MSAQMATNPLGRLHEDGHLRRGLAEPVAVLVSQAGGQLAVGCLP